MEKENLCENCGWQKQKFIARNLKKRNKEIKICSECYNNDMFNVIETIQCFDGKNLECGTIKCQNCNSYEAKNELDYWYSILDRFSPLSSIASSFLCSQECVKEYVEKNKYVEVKNMEDK